MILDTTSKKIRAYLSGAVATNQPEWNASWADHNLTTHAFTPGANNGVLNSATVVDLISSPSAGVQRQAKLLSIFNTDTANVIVTVETYDGANRRKWIQTTLRPNWTLQWEPTGWVILNGVVDEVLSGSTDGKPISITATSTPGTLIHTATISQEIYLYVSNITAVAATLTVEWGGTSDPADLLVKGYSIPANSAPIPVALGQRLRNGLVVRAFSGTSAALNITGYVLKG